MAGETNAGVTTSDDNGWAARMVNNEQQYGGVFGGAAYVLGDRVFDVGIA